MEVSLKMGDSGYSVATLAEQTRGEQADESDLPPWTGRVPPKLARCLAFEERAVSGDNTRRAADAVAVSAPERATEAIERGNGSVVAFETGVTEQNLDTGPLRALASVGGLVRHAGQKLVVTGGTNNGKTNVILLCVDVADRLIQDLLVIGNIPKETLSARWEDRYVEVETQQQLVDAIEDEPEREKFVIVDDASLDHGEGLSNSHEVRESAGRVTRLAAKKHSRIAYLAHREDGKGVSKHIRSMPGCLQLACQRILDEDGHIEEYVANVARGAGEDREFIETLGDLPEAQADYEPDATAHELFAGGSE